MDIKNLFIPITKVDEERRLVYGLFSAERPDASGEIMDYETGKPEFEAWSKAAEKRSQGRSKGNVRVMHGNIAAGYVTQIVFDDVEKTIEGCVKIDDENEWKKVGTTYTGFSIGGKYAKRWRDDKNPDMYRFTPVIAELSIVDNPCLPDATFDLIRANGSHEIRKFNSKENESMSLKKHFNDVTEPEQKWIAKDGSVHADKAEAFKKNKELDEAEIAKATENPAIKAAREAAERLNSAVTKRDFSDKERAAAADAGEALPDGSYPIKTKEDLHNAVQAFGRAKNKAAVKAHIISRAKSLGAEDALPEKWQGKKAKKFAAANPKLKKGMSEVARLACLIQELNWLCNAIRCEADMEEDESDAHFDLEEIIGDLTDFLEDLCEEECDELVAGHDGAMAMGAGLSVESAAGLGKFLSGVAADGTRAERILKMKAELEKAGSRHSKADAGHLAKAHEHADGIGEHLGKAMKGHENVGGLHKAMHEAHDGMKKCMEGYSKADAGDLEKRHKDVMKAMSGHVEDMGEHLEDVHKMHGKVGEHHESMHEHHDGLTKVLGNLGAQPEHAAKAAGDDELRKQLGESTDLAKAQNYQIETLNKTLLSVTESMTGALKRIEFLEKQPAPAKGSLFAVTKGHEADSGNAPNEPMTKTSVLQGLTPGEQFAMQNRTRK